MAKNYEDLDTQISDEFYEDLRDTADKFDMLLGNFKAGSMTSEDILKALRSDVMGIEVRGHRLHLPQLNLITHQFNEYLESVRTFTEESARDVQIFVDNWQRAMDGDAPTESPEVTAKLVRELPSKTTFEFDTSELNKQPIEALVVVPEKTLARIMEKQMAACGIRTTNVHHAYQAIEMAVTIKPDVIIVALEQPGLSGINLACAFNAMPLTQDIPVALLTSHDMSHPALRGMPVRTALMRKGAAFADDLADTLSRFNIA